MQSKVTSSPGSEKIVYECLKYDGPVFIKNGREIQQSFWDWDHYWPIESSCTGKY